MPNLVGDSSKPQTPAVAATHTGLGGVAVNAKSAAGVAVLADSKSGSAVLAVSESGLGVEVQSKSGTCISASSDSGIAIAALAKKDRAVFANSTSGIGVEARSQSNVGVAASSKSGIGIEASSDTGIAVRAKAVKDTAVFATSDAGMALDARSKTNVGVSASSDTGVAVEAVAKQGTGLVASSESGTAVKASAKKGTAVAATSAAGIAIAATATNDTAVFATSESGIGIDARSRNGTGAVINSIFGAGLVVTSVQTGINVFSAAGNAIEAKSSSFAAVFTGAVDIRDALGRSLISLNNPSGLVDIGVIGVPGKVLIRDASEVPRITLDGSSGDIFLTGADCAEEFDVVDASEAEPGTLMVIDDDGCLRPCDDAYDRRVAGVVSGAGCWQPGLTLDRQGGERRRAIALSGKVFCRADAAWGAIEIGALLTTSPTRGHAMTIADAARAFGAVVGKALRPLRSGRGLVPILVALQ